MTKIILRNAITTKELELDTNDTIHISGDIQINVHADKVRIRFGWVHPFQVHTVDSKGRRKDIKLP